MQFSHIIFLLFIQFSFTSTSCSLCYFVAHRIHSNKMVFDVLARSFAKLYCFEWYIIYLFNILEDAEELLISISSIYFGRCWRSYWFLATGTGTGLPAHFWSQWVDQPDMLWYFVLGFEFKLNWSKDESVISIVSPEDGSPFCIIFRIMMKNVCFFTALTSLIFIISLYSAQFIYVWWLCLFISWQYHRTIYLSIDSLKFCV